MYSLDNLDLPDDPTYLTLDIIIDAMTKSNRFPTYRTIASCLGQLTNRKPVSTATVQRYLFRLEELGKIERVEGKKWKLIGGKYFYDTA